MARLLIAGATVLTGDDQGRVLEDGYVLVDGNRIVEVGTGRPETTAIDEELNAAGMLVTPGFVNAHTHLCMILGRSLGSDRSLLHWLAEAQVPLMQAFEPKDYALSMELGAIENLKAGNTTVCEVFFTPHYGQDVDHLAAEALDRSGIRSVLFRCTNDESFFEGFVESRQQIVERAERLIEAWRQSDRTRIGVGPLVPWGPSAESFRDAVELSEKHGALIHLHTAETPEYNELVRQRTGKSNVEMLAAVGCLGSRVMLNHCVHLSEHDIELIAESGTHVIHDPTSNMLLASGVAPIGQMRAAGINLGLACDGPACNNTQDMIQTMKDAALLQKVMTREAESLTAGDVLAMATRGGANAVGMGDQLGIIQPGRLADLVLLETRVPHLTPLHDPVAGVVYSARGGDVRTVLVNGRVVVQDGHVTTLDEANVLDRARERGRRARKQAGL